MKPNKSGMPAVSKDVWYAMSQMHKDFAGSLSWLLRRSMSTTVGEDYKLPNNSRSSNATGLQVKRGMAEAVYHDDPQWRDAPIEWRELMCLAQTLSEWAELEQHSAEVCLRLAHEVRKGRPRKSNSHNALNALLGLLPPDPVPKARAGRPTNYGPAFDEAMYREVERLRQELSTDGGPVTITRAIEKLIQDDARAMGRSYLRLRKSVYNAWRSSYGRGKRAVAR